LKGLSNKHKLEEVKGEILVTVLFYNHIWIESGKGFERKHKNIMQTTLRKPRRWGKLKKDQIR
jgi:hypothetical protein